MYVLECFCFSFYLRDVAATLETVLDNIQLPSNLV